MTRIQDLPLEISLLELKQFLFSVRLWRKFYRYFILFTKSFSFQKTIDINLLPPLFWWILDEEFEMKSHNQWPWNQENSSVLNLAYHGFIFRTIILKERKKKMVRKNYQTIAWNCRMVFLYPRQILTSPLNWTILTSFLEVRLYFCHLDQFCVKSMVTKNLIFVLFLVGLGHPAAGPLGVTGGSNALFSNFWLLLWGW